MDQKPYLAELAPIPRLVVDELPPRRLSVLTMAALPGIESATTSPIRSLKKIDNELRGAGTFIFNQMVFNKRRHPTTFNASRDHYHLGWA